MFQKINILLLILSFFVVSENFGQVKPEAGNVIPEFGKTFRINNPEFQTDKNELYKVVFNVSEAAENPSEVNKNIETVARFLNMHFDAGKPLNTMEAALVIHGKAARDLLKNEFYKEIHKVDNPNIPLLKALHNNGVKIILCGQSAMSRNITEDRRIPEVQMALSAMTALIQLQNANYRLINF